MRPRDVAAAILVMLIWGCNFPMAKLGLGELPPMLMMTVRFALVAALLCPFVPRPPRDKLAQVLALSVTLGGIHFGLMFSGLARIDAAAAAILIQTQVPFATAIAAVVFRDRLSLRQIAGMAVAFAGVALIAGEPRFSDPVPILLILGASLAWAVANIQIKWLGAIDNFTLTGWIALFAAPQLLLHSLLLESGQLAALRGASLLAWGCVLYMALAVTVLSFGLWYPLLRRYPVTRMMPFTLLVPVFGILASILVLGERLGLLGALGGLATIGGVAVMVLRPAPRPAGD